MNTPLFLLRLALAGLLSTALATTAHAVVFTTTTAIGPLDTNYDGKDVVISNCTVTVDGPHTFASLRVAPGGTLTHSFWPNGTIVGLYIVNNEPQILNGTNLVTLLHTNANGPVTVVDTSGTITYSNGVDYVETDLPDGTIQIARTGTSSIPDGATVLVSYSWNYVTPAGLNLTVTGNVVVASGGSINANGIGYRGALGKPRGISPGSGSSSGGTYYDGSGGGHGGSGGMSFSNAIGGVCYDSLYQPTQLGSGGGASYAGAGANGGGAIQIAATGNVDIEGVISANGAGATYDRAGGGSGGSVWISAASVGGAGSITANGGAGAAVYGGGGGGGRIAIQCGTNTFSGTIIAYGGNGFQIGGAGTVFTQITGQNGLLVMDNGARAGANSTITLPTPADVLVQGNAGVVAVSPFNCSNLTVSASSILASAAQSVLALSAAGNLTIQAGGALTLDGLGYAANGGPGEGMVFQSGNYIYGGGGGHGGTGAAAAVPNATGGSTYDNQTTPTSLGSGGGGSSPLFAPASIGGAGGGALQLTVAGNLQVDGTLTANGGGGSGVAGGGGAGGAIMISAGAFAGSGSIMADGGNGADSFGGGGGGGRIAIVVGTNNFTGSLAAEGGSGAFYGGAGTIYLAAGATSELLLDNAGRAGASTPLQSVQGATLIVQNNAVGLANSGLSFTSLLVGSNAWLMASNANASQTLNLTVSGNATIQPGGAFIADSGGYTANNGPGHGSYYSSPPNFPGGGGGHGGYGAAWSGTNIGGGTPYDTISAPATAGSGGGGYSIYSFGGSGGGSITMNVSGALQVDGLLSANGGNGSGNGGGGGSGGSLNLTVGSLLGSGTIAANGGNGVDSLGGGGGGGMIAVSFTQSNLFTGSISACGGGGANYGGAGTIFIRTNLAQSLLIVDNAGHRGTNTPVTSIYPPGGLVVRNGAAAAVSQQTVASLLVTSNAWLVPGNNVQGTVNLTVNGNATIQAGGGILTDGAGSQQNVGTGAGHGTLASPTYPCSGAGYGGYGGLGFADLVPGGTTYGSTVSPSSNGSGGGGSSPYSIGGAGGGNVNLHFTGTLQLDGTISANGGNGSGSGGGGGSGGSISVSISRTGALGGGGSITANGGNGANAIGGGGGGGRIVLYTLNNPGYPPLSNSFAGVISAYGGGGASYGGAGTIYLQTNGVAHPLLLLDNGNHAGTNTSFDFLNNLNATIQNGAVGLLPVSGAWTPFNLLVRTNGTLTVPASATTRTVNATTVTIEAGGAISMDGCGYGPQSGPGAGYVGPALRGGGGHGGYGGGNGPTGGNVYDLIGGPTVPGSGGASYNSGPPYSYGGAGGGALSLIVSGTLTVNGRLSANGLGGGYNSGGGSGGSLSVSALNFTGNGNISASGGSGSGAAGGGGGGRVALICTANNFTGRLAAGGGNGAYPGGAGTILTRVGVNYAAPSVGGAQTLLVDNGGLVGTNTPLSSAYSLPTTPFDLNISGAASVVPLTPLPLLSNLVLAAGSTLTMPAAQSNLFLAVLNGANLAGSLNVDHLGYAQTNGPGAGSAVSSKGSGGGYGGRGGASSSGAPGGTTYGSATQPVDFGSGGGNGAATTTGGSDGGGALHLSVAGALSLNGNVSANGNAGGQDDSGGGAGGSLWISAGSLSGAGNISALGGAGAPLGGGGGGGGRIVIYTPTNNFTGATSVRGGSGWSSGQGGTILLSGTIADFEIVSQSPTGAVMNVVSSVDLGFNDAVDPASVSASNFTLVTPAGILAASNLTAAVSGPATVRVSFPPQNLLGNYFIQAATAVTNIFGLPLASTYTGTFSLSLPAISGVVTGTNGAPVTGVLLQPSGGLTGATTDTNGYYALGVPPGWNGTVTPSLGGFMFAPGSITYTNVTAPFTNQNYLMVTTIAPTLATGLSGANFVVNWAGLPGVTYQVLGSTNLVDWEPMGSPLPGTNGLMQFVAPIGSDSANFFRVSATQ